MNNKFKTNTYEFCDITHLDIDDLYDNPTEEQIKKWNSVGDDGDEFDGCIEIHLEECKREMGILMGEEWKDEDGDDWEGYY